MDRHDPNEEDIRARIDTYRREKGYMILKVDDCVHEMLTIINYYGKSLGILNARGKLCNTQGLSEVLGYYVDIRAIARNDPVARQWIQAECLNVGRHVCHGEGITLDSH